MPVFWAALLLCSLLAPPQGTMSLVAKVNVGDTTKSLAKHDLHKLTNDLLGGNLLSGLLDKDKTLHKVLRDGVLGRDGAVSHLLSGDGVLGGLLGRDSADVSLLGRDGAVSHLLSGDGVLGGLLGRDSADVSLLDTDVSVLGRDGAVGSLLSGNGAVGSLLGIDDAVGSLLGGDGAVGSLLSGNGAVGSLLGEDVGVNSINQDGLLGGLLGSVFSRGGVLDGLLGKNGLVDGVVDTLFGILLGKHGLLGKDGLVGNILGGNGGDLTGLKIVNNTLPKMSLHALPGFRYQVGFNTQLLVETTGAPGRELCLQVEADVVMLVQDKWAAHENNKDCETSDISIRVRPKVPLLDQPLKRFLSDALREVGCDIVSTGLGAVSTLLGSRTSPLPLRALKDLPPFSIVSDDAMQLDLNLLVGDAEGGVVASTQGPSLAATLLLAAGRPPQLSLPQRALSTLLELVQGQGAFNLNITNSMVPDSISLSTAALLPLIPQLSQILPRSLPLELRVEVADKPVVAVRDGGATATLKASIGIFSPSLQLSQAPLLSFNTDIVLNTIPLVASGELQTSVALNSINLTRAPLRLDPASASMLAGWLQQVLATAYVPAINDALSVSIPLPNVLNSSLRNAKVNFTDADDSSDQTNLKRSCSRGPLALLV